LAVQVWLEVWLAVLCPLVVEVLAFVKQLTQGPVIF
jgi:hypothetical protein